MPNIIAQLQLFKCIFGFQLEDCKNTFELKVIIVLFLGKLTFRPQMYFCNWKLVVLGFFNNCLILGLNFTPFAFLNF